MATGTGLLTVAEFLKLPDTKAGHIELHHGEVVVVPSPKKGHQQLQHQLLKLLESRGVDGRGIELSREGVNECVAKGLAVIQGDADADLADYPNDAFDYVVLSQTLQETRDPLRVLRGMLRVGERGVVAFPNFGHWSVRLSHLWSGRAPKTELFPYDWYD